jgi:hypothetical protein
LPLLAKLPFAERDSRAVGIVGEIYRLDAHSFTNISRTGRTNRNYLPEVTDMHHVAVLGEEPLVIAHEVGVDLAVATDERAASGRARDGSDLKSGLYHRSGYE